MARYVVMEPPAGADDARIIRDGFALFGFLLPPLWLLWHRLWLAALLAFGVMFGLSVLGEVAGFGLAAPALSLLVSLFVGLESRAMAIRALERRGWSEVAAFEVGSLADAEIRYSYGNVEPMPQVADTPKPRAVGPTPRNVAGPALGMLSYPGRG
jgi:hypothetical protein